MANRKMSNTLGEFLKAVHPESEATLVNVGQNHHLRDERGRFLPKNVEPRLETGKVFVVEEVPSIQGKVAAVEIVDHLVSIRRPWLGGKFDAKTQFPHWAVSNKLTHALHGYSWIDIKANNMAVYEHTMLSGFSHPSLLGGKKWKTLFACWDGLAGRIYMVGEDCPLDDLSKIGVISQISEMSQSAKFAKRGKRLFAPLKIGEDYVKGVVQEGYVPDSGEFVVEFSDKEHDQIVVKLVDVDTVSPEDRANCDGHIDVSPRFIRVMKRLGVHVKHGQSFTILTPWGMGKGHSREIHWLEPDLVIYGPKSEITSAGFEFGVRADLHPGKPHTDLQSVINFQLDRPQLMPKLAKDYLAWVYKSAHNELELRKAFLSNVNMEGDTGDVWSLLKWMRAGVSPFHGQPWMYRKVVRHLLTKALKVKEGRVPMEYAPAEGVAISRYVAGDLFAVMPDGVIDTSKSLIPEGSCCCMDLPEGEVVVYRQPNEHQNAFSILNNIHLEEYNFAKGGPYFYLGRGHIAVNKASGGADCDDSFVIVHDKVWVEAFKELNADPYPIVELEKPKEKPATSEVMQAWLDAMDKTFHESGKTVEKWGLHHAQYQLSMLRRAKTGIGPMVNAGLVDRLLSTKRNREYIAKWLLENEEFIGKKDTQIAIDWLAARKPDQLRKYMSHLEIIIDSQVKDSSLISMLGDVSGALRAFHKANIMYPRCLTGNPDSKSQRARRNRIPESKQKGKRFIVVETPLCRALDLMAEEVNYLMEAFRTNEWLLVQKADPTVCRAYKSNSDVLAVVYGVLDEDRRPLDVPEEGLLEAYARYRQEAVAEAESEDPKALLTNTEINALVAPKLASAYQNRGLIGIWSSGWSEFFGAGYTGDEAAGAARELFTMLVKEMVKDYEPEMPAIALELYRHYYRGVEGKITRGSSGERMSYPDGLLGLDLFNLPLLSVFEEMDMLGQLYAVEFPRYASLLKQVQLNVHVEKGVVVRAGDKKLLGFTKAPDGDYPMVAGLIEVKKADYCLSCPDGLSELPQCIDEALETTIPGTEG